MVTQQFPLHRFFHTLAWVATTVLFAVALKVARALRGVNAHGERPLTWRQIAIGAACGSYSHIVFDSVMHQDIRPLAPFSDANPLLQVVSLSALHWFCLAAGGAGLLVLGIRAVLREAPRG